MYTHKNGITLTKIRRDHLDLLRDLKNKSWASTHNIKFLNEDDQEKWFNKLDDTRNLFLIAGATNQPRIGLYKIQNIDWMNRKYDSAHDVFEKYRGKGYGKLILEAGVDFGFEVLNMNRIDTEILRNNIKSISNAKYAGFIEEGVKRKSIYKCREYVDSIVCGILREEWECLDRVTNYGSVCNKNYELG
jgi:RimJ/RimL family protein N-acetyltransferase